MIEKFSDKKMHKLIFDETPYKFYYVKLKSSPSIKNLCFDEGENRERIYKGEMDLEFVCPTPYAFSRT
jgi:phage-related protein